MALISDEDFIKQYWKRGYDEVVNHGRDEVSRSVGKRVMTWLAGVLFALAIYVSVKAGVLK